MKNENYNSESKNIIKNRKYLLDEEMQKQESQFSKTEMLQLIQELKGEKEYLKLLNKELVIAKDKAEITSKRHTELFNHSASGYFTISRSGIIIDLNHVGWEMIGKESSHIINTRFDFYITEDTKPLFYDFFEKIFTYKTAVNCDLTLINTNGLITYVQLTGITSENSKDCYITAFDITKSKEHEYAIGEEKERLSAIIKGTNVGTWEWNFFNGNVLYNNQYAEMIGYTMEELMPINSKTWRKYTHPDDLKKSDELIKKHINGEIDYYECELRMKHKNGDWVWILDKGRINKKDKDGKPIKISGTHQNITKRKQAEEFIRLSKVTYRGVLNNVSELIYILDDNGCFLYVNEATEKKYGYERDFLIGKSPEFLSAPGKNNLNKIARAIQLARKGKPQNFYFWAITKDRIIFPKEVNLTLGTYFEKPAVIAVARDITEQNQADLKLQESENRYRLLVESSNEGILVGQGTHLKFVNKKVSEISGYSKKELLTIPFINFIHPDHREMLMENYSKRINGEVLENNYSVKFIKKDSTIKWLEFSGVKIDWEGKPASMNFITDITERKKTEKSLIESEDRYRSLVEWSPEAIVVHRNGKILYANPAATKAVKAKSDNDLIGKSIFDLIHPDYLNLMLEKSKLLVNIGDFNPMSEAKFLNLNGKIINVETQSILIIYDGEPAVQASIRDISYKKELEDLLIKVNKIARLGAWELDLSNYQFTMSDITKDILEVEKDFEINLENVFPYFNLETKRDEIFSVAEYGMKNEKKWELELYLRTGKGNDLWIKIIGETEFINGKPTRINGSFQDINERKQTQIALHKNMKELEDYKFALDESAIIAITDKNGIIKNVNDNFCKISQFSREELLGNTNKIVNSNYHSKEFFKELWRTISTGNVWRGVIKNKKKSNEFYWVDTTIVPFLDTNNKPFQYLAIRFDVTEVKNAEEEIIKAKEHAEESDRLKSAFLANMSHEIRTPMNGIIGFTNLLKEANLSSEDQQEYIKIIDESGVRLLSIINDIIDISKIESRQMEVSNTDTNINHQIEYIFNFFKPEITNKGIDFSFENGLATNEAFIKTDSEKLYAILINLVKNAIKFCDKGTINFGYNLKENNEAAELEFYVKDSGIGIPNNRQQAIFDRFIQADISDKRAFQGAGLGLSISKAYVEMLGGKIWVESEVGIGSSFYFTIPYHAKPKSETIAIKNTQEKESEIQIKKLKILIVEDDPISKLLISKAVMPFSKEILKVSTGIQAIETCRNIPDIDLVMMDINMPEMSGHEATQQIRKFNKDVIIIAQTANALSNDKKKAIDSGCNDYISKPINKEVLMRTIQKYFAEI